MNERPLIDLPSRMAGLPRDRRGYPIPRFVHWLEGEPDFRVVTPGWLVRCYKQRVCWLCGEPLGKYLNFVIGPMCCVNRVTSEPPSHRDCAMFAVKNCPFLTKPLARRNERDLPETGSIPGHHLDRNPGCCAVWVTYDYHHFQAGEGVLFEIGDPVAVSFWREGRPATEAEVRASVESGLPHLSAMARAEGPKAEAELLNACARFEGLMRRTFERAMARSH